MACDPPTGIGQPTACPSVASISPAPEDTSDGIREIVCAATPLNNARASSPRSDPTPGCPARAAAVRPAPPSGCRLVSTACRRGTTAARRPGCRTAGRAGCATTHRRRARRRCARGPGNRSPRRGRQRIGVGDIRHRQLHATCPQVELGEERRGERQRVHRRADVVADPRELGVGRRPGTAARSRLGLEHPHRQTGACADHGGCQTVGSATDDGDVHARRSPARRPEITAH